MLIDAFRGTRVLEVVSGLSGSVAGRFFADLGAEVVRVEHFDPPPDRPAGLALLDWTRLGKRTLAPLTATRAAIDTLAAGADLVITDLPPRRLAELLPEPEALVRANPNQVVLDITAFGRTGPYADYLSTELVEGAISGYLYVCGLNEREPLKIGVTGLVDMISGVNAAGGAMIALNHARRTGRGQVVDVTRLETLLGSGLTYTIAYALTGAVRRRSASRMVPVGALVPCSDGFAMLSTYRASSDLLYVVVQDERILEERYATVVGRELHQEDLHQLYCDAFANRTKAEVMRAGQELRLQNAMVQTPLEVIACPQHATRHFFQPFALASGAEIQAPVPPSVPQAARDGYAHRRPEVGGPAAWTTERLEPAPPATAPLEPPGAKALDGLHVLELTFAWAGPFMGRILSDYGAEVVKVESRFHPDTSRGSDQVDLSFGENGRWLDRSPSYMIANVNKYHIGMELTDPVGREVVLDLVRWADVVVENFTPRVLPNLGLGWDVFHEANPALIMMSATGFGHGGPYRDYGAWGWGLEMQAGVAFSTGYFHDETPLSFNPTIPDTFSATTGITAIMAALEERRRTGEGQWIDLSQYECATFATLPEILAAGLSGESRPRLGNRHPWMAPHGVYRCRGKDEWVAVAVTTDDQWRRLCDALGRAGLASDQALRTHDGRREAHDRIDDAISKWTRRRTKQGAMRTLQRAGVPAGAVQNSKEIQHDPQIRQLGYFRAAHATETGLRVFPGPWHRPQATPGVIHRGPANFGEDNERVLRDLLRYDAGHVRQIMESGVMSSVQEGIVQPAAPGLPIDVQLERGYILSWDDDYLALPAAVAARHAGAVR